MQRNLGAENGCRYGHMTPCTLLKANKKTGLPVRRVELQPEGKLKRGFEMFVFFTI